MRFLYSFLSNVWSNMLVYLTLAFLIFIPTLINYFENSQFTEQAQQLNKAVMADVLQADMFFNRLRQAQGQTPAQIKALVASTPIEKGSAFLQTSIVCPKPWEHTHCMAVLLTTDPLMPHQGPNEHVFYLLFDTSTHALAKGANPLDYPWPLMYTLWIKKQNPFVQP